MAMKEKVAAKAGTRIKIGGVEVVVRPQPQKGQLSDKVLRNAVMRVVTPKAKK